MPSPSTELHRRTSPLLSFYGVCYGFKHWIFSLSDWEIQSLTGFMPLISTMKVIGLFHLFTLLTRSCNGIFC